jgi:hypothetical protein
LVKISERCKNLFIQYEEQEMMVCELWTIFWEGGASLLRMNAAKFSRLGGLVSLPRMKVEWAFTTHINGGRRPSPLIYVGRYRIFPLKGDQCGGRMSLYLSYM